jgi:hypothetical protein
MTRARRRHRRDAKAGGHVWSPSRERRRLDGVEVDLPSRLCRRTHTHTRSRPSRAPSPRAHNTQHTPSPRYHDAKSERFHHDTGSRTSSATATAARASNYPSKARSSTSSSTSRPSLCAGRAVLSRGRRATWPSSSGPSRRWTYQGRRRACRSRGRGRRLPKDRRRTAATTTSGLARRPLTIGGRDCLLISQMV